MIDHIGISVTDVDKAIAFYTKALAPLGYELVMRIDEGEFHGDLVDFDGRGRLVITGRASDTIITGGENVAPTEVEDVLLEHPAVTDAAVHSRADPEWGERVVATVVARDEVSPEQLQAHCSQRLARFKVPKEIAFAEEFPRTASGKLLRREL